MPSVVSLQLQLGLGGGDGVVAGRAGAQIDIWQPAWLGIGVLGAATSHSQTDFEGYRVFTLIGPVLSLRRGTSDSHYRSALALGLATRSCRPGADDEEGTCDRSALGAELLVGYMGREGAFGFGWHLGLALLPGPRSGDGAIVSVTLNLDLGAEL